MADLADVERALVTLVAGSLFADAYLPGAVKASNAGVSVRAYRGWPLETALMADIKAGYTNISIFPEQGMTRNVSRWVPETERLSTVSPTITAFASGATVTLSGTITAGNVAGIQGGFPLQAYAYIVRAGDTLATVAAALAAKVPGASASGPVVTMPSVLNLTAGTMTPQTVMTTVRQQQQGFRLSVWSPTPSDRDTIAGAVDNAIAGMRGPTGFQTRWFAVTPYESGRIEYRTTYVNDAPSREGIWRRDLCYSVEFATTLIEQNPIMLFGGGTESIGSPVAATRQIGALPPS